MYVIIFLLSSSLLIGTVKPKMRIHHGSSPSIKEFPYMVKVIVRLEAGYASCTGSYVHVSWVLSAAHCVGSDKPKGITCCMGTELATIEICPNERKVAYSAMPTIIDLLMLKLEKPFDLGPTIQLARLITDEDNVADYGTEKCTAAGWGKVDDYHQSDVLKTAQVQIVRGCNRGQICVFLDKEGPCKGDSGGPLICKGVIVGVLSAGSTGACGLQGTMAYYVDLQRYLDFVEDAIADKYNRCTKREISGLCMVLVLINTFFVQM